MQLTIDQVTNSKSGKALRVKAGNEWYGANLKSGLKPGMTIEAAINDKGYGPWIDSFRDSVPAAKPAQTGQTPPAVTGDRWYMPFVSNVCAHAISAGKIQTPGELSAWAKAARDAADAIGIL